MRILLIAALLLYPNAQSPRVGAPVPQPAVERDVQRVAMEAGRGVSMDEQTSTSAYVLELAVQARHMEWLRDRPVDADLVRRIREDSIRAGNELVAIVDEWRNGS